MDPPLPFSCVPGSFEYTVNHVFFPYQLPESNGYTPENDLLLVSAVCAAAHTYTSRACEASEVDRWHRVTKMLDNLQASVQSVHLDKDCIITQLRGMQTGDILTFFVTPQNAAIILAKKENSTLCETFEVSPNRDAIRRTPVSLICSYPWSAVETPNEVFNDSDFQLELANFLSLPGAANSDLPCPPSSRSDYITALLTGILRGVGRTASVPRITKHIRDEDDWRRSSLWLLIRVAIQRSIGPSLDRASYKRFMLYFICILAKDGNNASLSDDVLHTMASKILRRLSKSGFSDPDWLFRMALETCSCLQDILDARCSQPSVRPSPFRSPSKDELVRDTNISLLKSHEYIHNALANPTLNVPGAPFRPSHRPHFTLEELFSSNGSGFQVDASTLYHVQRLVEQGIDEWLACVTNVDDACTQLSNLVDKYVAGLGLGDGGSSESCIFPEYISTTALTLIELLIALDKLVVKEIPMLADYSPDIPTTFLEGLCLRRTTSLHRLSCAYQYLSARHSRSHPGWSALSDEFTEDSLPVRYFDQSPHLQQLKVQIEGDVKEVTANSQQPQFGHMRAHDEPSGQLVEDEGVSQLPLPVSAIHAKVVVFELRCPPCVCAWRSAIARLQRYRDTSSQTRSKFIPLANIPVLQPYLFGRQRPSLRKELRLVYFYPDDSCNGPTLHYAVVAQPEEDGWPRLLMQGDRRTGLRPLLGYYFESSSQMLLRYATITSHTSNEVLASQADCPDDLSLDEFIAFGHLRSGCSLQWLNILNGLRSRTLNLRRPEVHFLLAHAAFRVGPLDMKTGTWVWHQELQDSSFCNALLDELERLFIDGTRSVNRVLMNTISLLLTRVLASSPSGEVSDRATALLRSVRKKTFSWVQDLSYDLMMAPTSHERANLLWDMAATCRSTLDVDPADLRKHFKSAEDVDAMLSCAFFIRAHHSEDVTDVYSRTLLSRDSLLSPALEETLGDVIRADPSEFGLDLAVAKIFTSYHPSAPRWVTLQYPSEHCLTCKTKEIDHRPSQMLHVDLLDGSLRLDGKPFGGLPQEIRDHPEFRRIFRGQSFFVMPSNLPGMDTMTLAMTCDHRVHLSLRGHNLVLRAQHNGTDEVLELIPSGQLEGDLPPALVDRHVHWLNRSTNIIEIRPLERLWERSPESWKVDCSFGRPYRVHKGPELLVDIYSQTWMMLFRCFERFNNVWMPLGELRNETGNLLITTLPIDSGSHTSVLRLSITLPRYGLSFFVNTKEELESCDFKDVVYDEHQCIGALFGLENLLVLRPKSNLAELIPKRVVIPNGLPQKNNHQVKVDITRIHAPPEPLYHTYIVDTELGCLMGDGGLASTQFLAQLHAITTSYRPDPLTGKTGAQAGLWLLRSGGCRSIMKLKASDDNDIDLTYPHLGVAYTEIIRRHYWDRSVYNLNTVSVPKCAQRAASLFSSNLARPIPPEGFGDMDYSMPKSDLDLQDVVSTAAFAICRWSTGTTPVVDTILCWEKLWIDNTHVDTTSKNHNGPKDPDLLQTLRSKVHAIMETREEETRSCFQLLFLLPMIAYCSPSHQTAFLSMLIAFTMQMHPHLRNPPIHAGFEIWDGYRPTEEVLRDQIHKFRIKDGVGRLAVDISVQVLLKDWPCQIPPGIPLDSRYYNLVDLTTSLQQLFSSCSRNLKLRERLTYSLGVPDQPTLTCEVSSLNESILWQITLERLLSERLPPELPPPGTLPRGSRRRDKTSQLSNDSPPLVPLFSSLQGVSKFQREYLTQLEMSAHKYEESRVVPKEAAKVPLDVLQKHYIDCRRDYQDALHALQRTLGPATVYEQALERSCQWPLITADLLLGSLASTSPFKLPGRWKQCLVSFALLLLALQRARRLLRLTLDGLEEVSRELKSELCDGWKPEEYPDWLLIQIQGNFLIRRMQTETAMEMMSPQSGQNTAMQVNMGEGKSSVIIPIVAAALANGEQLARVIVPKALTAQMFDLLVSRLGGLTNRTIYYLPFSRSPEYGRWGEVISLQIDDLRKFMSQCIAERGILLVQPEHVVSLKLRSVEEQIAKEKVAASSSHRPQKSIYEHVMTALSLKPLPKGSFMSSIFQRWSKSSNQPKVKNSTQARHDHEEHNNTRSEGAHDVSDNASKWERFQTWLHSRARDILDESDEILHSRFQLIYTIGLEQHMDGYPNRWTITQRVLQLVKTRAYTISRNHPDSIEYERGPHGSFPRFRIVRASNIGRHLISMIVEDIMDGKLPHFNFQRAPPALRNAIRCFISDEDVLRVPNTVESVEGYAKCSGQNYLWGGLLLFRGLLSSSVLLFALSERRWRVDYGLVPQPQFGPDGRQIGQTPTMLAVPYRAKDVPAPNTQFGHPDLTIILTCLSYYYAGLTEEQLRTTFEMLLDQDDPHKEYAFWVEGHDLESFPDSLRNLSDINLKSSEQWDRVVFPLFSRSQAAIDFYLARVVFPKEAKEFPWKLCGSSWDLAERRERLITGFSGTNDGRWLLPMSIGQHDLEHQRETNASVLAYLLRPENNFYEVAHDNGEQLATLGFLRKVTMQRPKIRVVLDVGAQILDLSNHQFAKAWLEVARDAIGAVFFDGNDELTIISRNGITQPLFSSPLSQQLDCCIVYLDHAHTRGTDLKFPVNSRAAVTLGPKVTKDALVQGCMRMRKLGHGHSVMFFAQPGVDQSIRAVSGKTSPKVPVTTLDILRWAIHETWTDIELRASYWAQQGMNHKTRYEAWSRFCNNELTREQLSDTWLQPELKSLTDLYAPGQSKNAQSDLSDLDPDICQRCKDLGVLSPSDPRIDEEQEREVNRERERERELERPPKARPAVHRLHPAVIEFVKTGNLPPLLSGGPFLPVFTTLEKSSAATREADVWSPSILATADFSSTINPKSTKGTMDQYLRPVQWILSSNTDRGPVLVILSPFEADRLMPEIRASDHVHLHLYAPRTAQSMKPSDDLKFYTIPSLSPNWTPPWDLIDQLNVFAGQLYLRDYQSYLRLCHFLEVPTKESPDDAAKVRRNPLNVPGAFEKMEIKFLDSPLPSVMALLAVRNRGRPFDQTHMGKILHGQIQAKEDFEKPKSIAYV